LGDGRQSGTSDSPSILNASPESAVGGGLAWLRTGDRIRVDLNAGRCDVQVDPVEWEERKKDGIPAIPASQTPWQEIYRSTVGQMENGACMELAVPYRGVANNQARHNH
ncbi:MAG: dihydroxy-acid dehydratase, partial [Pseudomonadota bacterium]